MNDFKFMGYVGSISFEPAGGKKIAKISVAQTNYFKDATGNKKEKTTWVSHFVAWEKTAERMEKLSIKEGSRLLISSQVEENNYEKDGKKIYSYNFVVNNFWLLDKKTAPEVEQKATTGEVVH